MTRIRLPTVFRDSENIYLEFPTTPDGILGLILRFPFTEGGLSKALRHIPDISPPPGHAPVAPRILAVAQERKVRRVAKRREPAKYAKQESKEFLGKLGLTRAK